jgi:cyanophycinase
MTTLMPIGGNTNDKHPSVLREFIRLAGGSKADIIVLPQPSQMEDTGDYYSRLFLELGAHSARSLDFRARAEVDSKTMIAQVQTASGVFITGGSQMRLPAAIGGTKFETALLNAFRRGTVFAGTSAGAAVMSGMMIGYGKGGPTPRAGIAQFVPGLGLTEKLVIDQHFRQRDRLGRLLYVIAANPGLLGVGVDENTAAIVEDETTITVVGSGAVTIVDGSGIEASTVAEVGHRGAVAVSNVLIHILTEGCSFDIPTRKATIPQVKLLRE